MVGRRLLADEPRQLGLAEVRAQAGDRRPQAFRGFIPEGMERHVVLADVVDHTREPWAGARLADRLHRRADEFEERRIEIAFLRHAALGRPVDDLRATVGELCDRDRTPAIEFSHPGTKRDFRAEGVVQPRGRERLPSGRGMDAATDRVAVGDLLRPRERGATLDRGEVLHEGAFTFHVAMSGEDPQIDFPSL